MSDYVGDYVGDEIDDLIKSAQGVGAAARMARRAPAGAGAGATTLQRSDRTIGKRAPLGFGTYSLAAAASVTLTATVQRAFQADRLLVTSSQLGVVISSVKIGDEEQLLGGTVPAELYGVNALADSKPDDFTPSPGGIQLSVSLTNNAATTSTGAVGMKGYVKR